MCQLLTPTELDKLKKQIKKLFKNSSSNSLFLYEECYYKKRFNSTFGSLICLKNSIWYITFIWCKSSNF